MKKRIFSFVLILTMVTNLIVTLTATASTTTSGICGSNLAWELDSATGTLTIIGTGDMDDYIYWEFEDSDIKNLIISNGVTSIADHAFYYFDNLENVTISDSVTSIGNNAFYGCESIINLSLGNNVATIGEYAFYDCKSIENVSIPDSVNSIGNYAFYGCENITNLSISNNVTSIGDYTFYDCESIINVIIPNSVMSIGNYAFYGCRSIKNLSIGSNVVNIGDYAFCDLDSLKTLAIPDRVSSIGNGAFKNCSYLAILTISKSVKNIGNEAFSWCDELSDVYYVGDETEWNEISFGSDNNSFDNPTIHYNYLEPGINVSGTWGTDFTWSIDNKGTLIINGKGKMPTSSTLGIPWYSYRTSIVNVVIGNGITSIRYEAFSDCYILKNISIPDSITTIGGYAFSNCYSLTDITMPNSITTIGNYAFSNCYSLTDIIIPDSVTSIGEGMFSECGILSNIKLGDNVSSIPKCTFTGCRSLTKIKIPDSVTSIYNGSYDPDNAFYGCSNLTDISLGKCTASISRYTFGKPEGYGDCYNLSNIEVSEDNTRYSSRNGILYNKDQTSLIIYPPKKSGSYYEIPATVTSIGAAAFYNCNNLTCVNIPNSVTSIGTAAFYNCRKLTDINIPNSVKYISAETFCSCGSLTSINIPNSITSIGSSAFENCVGLTQIIVPDSVTNIGSNAFNNCSSATEIDISQCGITTINEQSFFGCKNLKNITIPDGVTYIDDNAFGSCNSLTSITIPDSLYSIGDYAFNRVSLSTIHYSGNSTEWRRISIGKYNGSLSSGYVYVDYNYIPQKIAEVYEPTSSTLINDEKLTEIATENITKNYPKHTTVRPKTTNNSANLVGDWEVKNTTVETGEINSGVTISLSGDLIVENGVFKVTKGTTMNAASLKVGTNGQVIVDGTLNIDGDILLYGGSSKVSGGYLELNRSNSLFDVTVTTCGSLKLSDYGHITVNGRFDINGDMTIATQSTASNYTNQGSIWLRGNLTQKKDGLFAPGNTFCPKEKFKLILNQNISSAVHKLKFDSPKKSYINDLYIVKGSYDNFYDGNAEINGLVKRIIEANNDKGYVFENVTADFKKEQSKWNTAFNELFNTISSKTAGYVDLATNQSYFKHEFGEDTYNALRAYFGVLCLSMQVDPPSSFGYVGIKDSIPHYVKFYNSAKEKWVNGKFIVDAIDLAEISGTRTISYKCSDGETRIFCVLMHGNIEPLGNQLMELVSSNYADYYTGILGTTLNAFNKEPQKYIAKLLWEGVAHTKIPGLKDLSKSTMQDFISSQSFQNFVSETCNYNPSRTLLLSIDDKQELSTISLFSDDTHSKVIANSTLLLGTEKGIFTDDAFETAVREKLGLSDDEEITEAMLAGITSLSLPEKNIVSIKGIEYMTSLRKLDLSGNAITDISYISELSELTEISLNGNNIYDISALEKLSSLKKLMINSNYISDLTPVVSLTALQVLDIGNNLVNDISSIENLVNIKQLNVAYNSITSLNALCKMTSLKVLYAHNNLICDISDVAVCPLIDVNLSNNSITDISAFEDSGIVELDLSNNPIGDVSALNGNTSLATLILEGTSVDDETVDVIATLTGIKKLSVQNTVITDISAFSTLTSLEELSVANTYVSDLSALEGIYWLKKLDISDNNISNLSFISSLTNMKELYADNCLITDSDLEELSKLTSLTILSLSSNCISNIDFANTLTRLTYLDLSNNANINKQTIEEKRALFENKGNTFIYTLANVAVTNIFMDSEEKIIDFGSRVTDFAHIYPYNASKNDVIYSSSDNTIVTYENNVLTAVSEGKATVTAQNTEGDIIATCDIIVKLGAIKAIIKSAEINDNEFTAEIESFSSEDMENISIILGIYGDNNEFKKAKQLRTDIAAKSSLVYTIEDISIEDDCDYYKVFVWNSELCPLSNVFMGELQKSFAVDDVLESEHPYGNYMNETKTYTYEGKCTSIDVTFSSDTMMESSYDFIYIYDANNNEIGMYTGLELAGQTINVPGNTVKIRLTSDGSVTRNGYRTESIVVNK